ncbi:MAG: adenylate/guanylate cyclase domain-containing protein [Candidatus Schekmanbacteria bacterium]|nr:adenylate/guanylate cyclase domain-containing protein [Candidatus Schekmanbacteria bacterium]
MDTNRDYNDFVSGLRTDEKLLAIQMISSFSTWEPFDQVILKQLNLIGLFLRTWLDADKAIHYFTNPQINKVNWIEIGKDDRDVAQKFKEQNDIYVHFPGRQISEITNEPRDISLYQFCQITLGKDYRYLLLPFDQNNIPFGHYVLAFKNNIPDKITTEKIRGSLNVLHNLLKTLLYNQYPITGYTYLPSFLSPQTADIAILFCDIRNSTSMFEIARMTHPRYAAMVIAFLKSFLEYTSQVISVRNVGRIHKFMGDGVMATFGEYLTLKPEEKAVITCILGLLTSRLLIEGFNELWSVIQNHDLTRQYLSRYNEDLELRLGVGLNYGQVSLESFGIATEQPETGFMRRGFYEFTAVGDHVNFAQRLCSIASKPIALSNIIYRSNYLDQTELTAPIVISKTVAYWIRTCSGLKRRGSEEDPLISYRCVFNAKGKGHPMSGFEVTPKDIESRTLLESLKNIHDNRYYTALSEEINASVSDRPLLKEIKRCFIDELNKINC